METVSNRTRSVLLGAAAVAVLIAIAGMLLWEQLGTLWPATPAAVAPTAPVARSALPSLDNRRVVAILPFAGGDPGQAYLANGISEDIRSALTRFDGLLVIARNSTQRYGGKPDAVRLVGQELGAKYALQGEAANAAGRAKITVKLIDSQDGRQLWEKSFDQPLAELPTIQGEIIRQVVTTAMPSARKAQIDAALPRPAAKIDAYDLTLKARGLYERRDRQSMTEARRLALLAVDADPSYAPAYAWLGRIHHLLATMPGSPEYGLIAGIIQEEQLAARAINLDPDDALAHMVRASALSFLGEHDEALAEVERAVELNPGNHEILTIAASQLGYYGLYQRALELRLRAMRLDPHYPGDVALALSSLYDAVGDRTKAIESLRDCRQREPSHQDCLVNLASLEAQLGRLDDARKSAVELMRVNPDFRVADYMNDISGRGAPEDEERLANGLRQAGLPE